MARFHSEALGDDSQPRLDPGAARVVGEDANNHTLLSLTLPGLIARDMVNPKGRFPAQFNTYKVVGPGDFVFCLFDIDETPRGVGPGKEAQTYLAFRNPFWQDRQ
jgi:hypothetical protein